MSTTPITAVIKISIFLISNVQPLPSSNELPLKSLWDFSFTLSVLTITALAQALSVFQRTMAIVSLSSILQLFFNPGPSKTN